MIIKNAKVYSDGCRFVEKDLIIRDGRIVFGAAPQEGEEVIDAGGAYALPGLVDIHFHGAVGHDFCDADEAGLQAIADFEASKGVLAICPATMTFSEEILNGIMDVAAAHKNERTRMYCAERHRDGWLLAGKVARRRKKQPSVLRTLLPSAAQIE